MLLLAGMKASSSLRAVSSMTLSVCELTNNLGGASYNCLFYFTSEVVGFYLKGIGSHSQSSKP